MKFLLRYKRFLIVGLVSSFLGVSSYFLSGSLLKAIRDANMTQTPLVEVKPTPHPFPPTQIAIFKLSLTIPVVPATVNGNDWELYDDKVSWLSTSQTPGGGNVILYAHNRPKLFGNLYTLARGDTVDIYQNDKVTRYYVRDSVRVTSNSVESILSDENRLTLYTCAGYFDEKRRVVYAYPERPSSIP